MTSIGLNILGDRPNVGGSVEAARQLRAAYHVVMDNPALAAQIAPLCTRGLIYRMWRDDDNAQERTDPVQFVRQRHDQAPTGALLYLGNEPWPTKQLADWTLAALDECERLGRRGVVFNFSTGNPELAHWPIFEPVLRRLRRGGHVLGLHEYFDRRWNSGDSHPWHVGRVERVIEYMRMLGIALPDIVITELGECRRFVPDRGYRWNGDGEALSDDDYARQLVEVGRFYRRLGIAGACVFAYTNDSAADDWQTFHPRPRVIELLAAHNNQTAVAPAPPSLSIERLPDPPAGEWRRVDADALVLRDAINGAGVATLTRGDYVYVIDPTSGWVRAMTVTGQWGWFQMTPDALGTLMYKTCVSVHHQRLNVRQFPAGPIVGQLAPGQLVELHVPDAPISAARYAWALVRAADGLTGWIARLGASWEAQFVEPPPPLLPVPYMSQHGHPSRRRAMCGPAAVWMLAAWVRKQRSLPMPSCITVDCIMDYTKRARFTTRVDLIQAGQAFGVELRNEDALTIERIIEELNASRPPIVLLDYGHLSERVDRNYMSGHYMVAVGYDDAGIWFADPNNRGVGLGAPYVRYRRDDVQRALSDPRWSGNPPNLGLVLKEG